MQTNHYTGGKKNLVRVHYPGWNKCETDRLLSHLLLSAFMVYLID